MARNLPKLTFGETNLVGDAAGLESAYPDPDKTEYASPERAGINEDGADLPAEDAAEPVVDSPSEAADGEEKQLEATKSEWAQEPEHGEDEQTEAEPASKDDFSPELLAQAERYGYDAESAKRFGSPENLQWAMADADRRAAEWGQKQLEAMQQTPPEPPAPQTPAPPQPPAQQLTPQQQQQQFELNAQKLSEQGFDNDTIQLLTGMHSHYQKQFEEQQQLLAAMYHQFTGQSAAEVETQFEKDMDAFFDGLGSEWESEFGKGAMRSLKPNSPEWVNRRKLAATVGGLRVSDAQLNQNVTDAERARRALNADPAHFKKQQELARKALSKAAGERRTQAVARSGSSKPRPMTGDEKANRRAEAFYRKHGLAAR